MNSAAADRARRRLAEAVELTAVGRIDDAEGAMAAAEAIYARPPDDVEPWAQAPDFLNLLRDASIRLGRAHLAQDAVLPALSHLAQAVNLGADETVQDLVVSLLMRVRFRRPHALSKSLVQRALEERWIDPSRLGRLAAALLVVEPGAGEIVGWGAQAIPASAVLEGPVATFLRDPLLLDLLDRVIVVDADLERVLTQARRALLGLAASPIPPADAGLERFAVALADQGFANEYAWTVSQAEVVEVQALQAACAQAIASGRPPSALQLAVLAGYRPLRSAADGEVLLRLALPESLRPLLQRQVREPMAEEARRTDIPVLTAVEDHGSRLVRGQYEDNPFPRWVSAPARRRRAPLPSWIADAFPAAAGLLGADGGRWRVLIAGCGTGIETAAFVQSFDDVEVLAVDLSLASLAHAERRADVLGLDHLAFAQADLLELPRLERRFDVVVSAGVLHHLDDPRRGLEALHDVVRPGGVLMLALYSRLGRRMLEPARAFARAGAFDASEDGLRGFRSAVREAPASDWRDRLLLTDDFYSLSTLRDLLFHVREALFDPGEIAAMLGACGLRFLGFQTSPEIAQAFTERFGEEADPLSLEQWTVFEAERPDTFHNRYYLLAERP